MIKAALSRDLSRIAHATPWACNKPRPGALADNRLLRFGAKEQKKGLPMGAPFFVTATVSANRLADQAA
jgi:hypothetical protein